MREIYDQITKEGEAGIDRLISERTQENVQLDFKRKENERVGEFSTNDRRMLAEALSGFANSAGGLLILGVDARPGPDRIDCAQEARPIANIRRFLSEATTEVGQLVQPRLDGVQLSAIPSERAPNAGYLLVLVNRSERRPHRSEAKGQKAYYKRHGDSFYEMEHYDIEDAFSRLSAVSVELRHVVRSYMVSVATKEFTIDLYMKNNSDVIGKYPYVIVEEHTGCIIEPGVGEQPLRSERGIGKTALIGGANDVVHPHTEKHVANFRARFIKLDEGAWVLPSSNSEILVKIKCLYGCEGSRPLRLELTLLAESFGLGS